MSWKAVRYVRDQLEATPEVELSRGARSVALVLATYANPHSGDAFPSSATIGAVLGLADVTVRRYLVELESAGLIAARRRAGRSTVFRFPVVEAVAAVADRPQPRAYASRVDDADPARMRAAPRAYASTTPRAYARRNWKGSEKGTRRWCDASCSHGCDGTGYVEHPSGGVVACPGRRSA